MIKRMVGIFLIGVVSALQLFAAEKNIKEEAVSAFVQGEYDKSYDLFKRLSQENRLKTKWLYFLGRSAFEIGKYQEALESYLMVEKIDPENVRVKLEIARVYFRMRSWERAKRYFIALEKKEGLPKVVKENIRKYLLIIKRFEKIETKKIAMEVGAGFYYDSNVKNSADVDRFYLPGMGIFVENGTKKRSDTYAQYHGTLSFLFKRTKTREHRLRFFSYIKNYANYTSQNIALVQLDDYWKIHLYQNNLLLFWRYGYQKIFFGSDAYYDALFLSPWVEYFLDKYQALGVGIKIERKMAKSDMLEDSIVVSSTVRYQRAWKNNKRLMVNLSLFKAFTLPETTIIYQDKKGFEVTSSFLNRLPWMVDAGWSAGYRYTKYDKKDLFFQSVRDDRYLFASFQLNRSFSFLDVGLKGSVMKNMSNQEPYHYKKYYLGLQLAKGF